MTEEVDPNDPIPRFQEQQEHRYDPGYWVTHPRAPFPNSSRGLARKTKVAIVLMAAPAVFALTIIAFTNERGHVGPSAWYVLVGRILIALFAALYLAVLVNVIFIRKGVNRHEA
jgi:hypothetical protein